MLGKETLSLISYQVICPDCGSAMIIIESLVCKQLIRAPPRHEDLPAETKTTRQCFIGKSRYEKAFPRGVKATLLALHRNEKSGTSASETAVWGISRTNTFQAMSPPSIQRANHSVKSRVSPGPRRRRSMATWLPHTTSAQAPPPTRDSISLQ